MLPTVLKLNWLRLSSRYAINIITFILLICSSSTQADQQWPLPDEVTASLLHEIPVLHTAFVQIGEELHYLSNQVKSDAVQRAYHSDGKNEKMKYVKQESYNVNKLAGKGEMPIELDPPMMDFGQNAVGTVQKRKIYIRNMLDKEISLDAIFVNSIEFQVSYFENYRLASHGTTTVEVVFLPREVGRRATNVHFTTSEGVFDYKFVGECVSNPYRISPFSGFRIPLNSTITKPIQLYNPHPYTMRISEISSTGGNAHIELPHGIDERYAEEPPQYWDIRPFQTKKIANIVLSGAMTENSTLFVRIAAHLQKGTDLKLPLNDIFLTIPIEVTRTKGVYATEDILDFGILQQGERSKPQVFAVSQYLLPGSIDFETLYVEKGDHTGIYMEFASHPPIAVMKGQESLGPKSDLVKVYYDASRISLPEKPIMKHMSGSIIAVSRGGNYNVSIPFRADVFRGELKPVGNDLSIQEDLLPPHQRIIRIHNQLPFDIAVWNISVETDAGQFFSVRLIDDMVAIRSSQIAPAFILKYNKKMSNAFEESFIMVHTNVTTFKLPMQKFSGKMNIELTSVDKTSFDFGFVERNDTRTIRFVVWNHNRAEMRLKNLAVPSRQAYRLYEVGTQHKGNFSDIRNDERQEYTQPTDVDILSETGKIFDLELKVPQDGLVRSGSILFETDYESKIFGVTYNVSTGVLKSIPEEIAFGQTCPAKVVYRTLQVFNTFNEDMTVTRLTTLNQDPRFYFEGFDPNNPPLLRSGRLTNLGRIMFSPSAPCNHEYCYLGFPLESSDGQWFTHGLTLPANLPEIDSYLYKRIKTKFDNLVKSGRDQINTTVIIDTDKAKNIKVKTSAELVWPKLLTRNSIHFPLTALGNFTIVNLTLANPTNVPVAIQVIPLVIYPDAEALVEVMRPFLSTPLTEHVEMNETLMFSLRDTELFTLKPDSPVPKLREEFETHLNGDLPRYNGQISIPRFTLSMILKPHMKVRLRLGFLPSDYSMRSSLLLIRNNLTALEPVVMYGKGARIGIQIENTEARTSKPLLFEIGHNHLSDCNNPKRLMHKLHSTLTVRRLFQVWNNGEVQFTVTNMSINGVPCENRGFRILNCYPFRLMPNESYALDIAYTPDFLATHNEADLQLYMHMNGSAWIFPISATVPEDMLSKCHSALPRPPFENIMYYSCVTALIFCLVCVLACAYLEGDRAIACAIRQQFTAPRHTFDFNNLLNSQRQKQQPKPEPPKVVEVKQPEKPKESWKNGPPSTLRASADAWFVSRILINIANYIVQLVYSVWKWSLFYRKEKQVEQKNTTKKKKKTPVTMVKRKEEMIRDGEETDTTTASNNNRPTKKMSNQASTSSLPSAAGQKPQNQNQNKVTKSPKPKVQKGGRKKSNEQQIVPPVKENLKPRDLSKNSGRTTPKKAESPAPRIPSRVPSQVRSPVSQGSSEVQYTTTFSANQQFISPGFYQPQIDNELDWNSPAAQVAMQYLNLWNCVPYTDEQMQMYLGQAHATGNKTPTQVDDRNLLTPTASEITTAEKEREDDEDSTMPDWADEEVNLSDAEADFTSMASSTERMGFDEEPLQPLRNMEPPVQLGGRRLTIGSEKKELFAKTPGRAPNTRGNITEQAAAPPPPPVHNDGFSPMWSDHNLTSYLFSGNQDANAYTASNPPWGGLSLSDLPSSSTQPQQQSPVSAQWGLDLGGGATQFGTMFTGREFNLWSDSQFDPTSAWGNLGLGADNKESKDDEKKNNKQ